MYSNSGIITFSNSTYSTINISGVTNSNIIISNNSYDIIVDTIISSFGVNINSSSINIGVMYFGVNK